MWSWIPLIAVLVAALVIVAWFFAWRGARLRYLRANSLVVQTSRGPVEYAKSLFSIKRQLAVASVSSRGFDA